MRFDVECFQFIGGCGVGQTDARDRMVAASLEGEWSSGRTACALLLPRSPRQSRSRSEHPHVAMGTWPGPPVRPLTCLILPVQNPASPLAFVRASGDVISRRFAMASNPVASSRRSFLKLSATAATMAGLRLATEPTLAHAAR